MPSCPYHGGQRPCRECLVGRMGEFAHFKPGTCPYHAKAQPCVDCFDNNMGRFAHSSSNASSSNARSEPYVPPHKRRGPIVPVHFHQKARDTCAVACCGMVGATLNCPRRFTRDSLLRYMKEWGIYCEGAMSATALNYPLEWLGLECEMRLHQTIESVRDIVRGEEIVIIEVPAHVIVVFGANSDGTLIIGDPAMYSIENSVPITDYRLKLAHPGRIWIARRA